jgi:hypothetical protein
VETASESAVPSVERALELLAGSGMVAFGGVGFAGTLLPETTAFEVLVSAGSAVRPELEKLLASATPAGKIYAATALQRIDPDAGVAAWRHLAGDGSDVTIASGCIIGKRPVSQYASEQLDQRRAET